MKGLSLHDLTRCRQISLPCRVFLPAVKLETVTRGWRVRFSPAQGAVSALSLTSPRPRGHPRPQARPAGSAEQGKARQGRAGPGRAGGPAAPLGRRCPALCAREGRASPVQTSSRPASAAGFGATPSWHVVTGFHTHRAWERREVPAGSPAPSWLAAAAIAGAGSPAGPGRAGKRRSPPAGQRRSKWLSVRLPPGPLAPLGSAGTGHRAGAGGPREGLPPVAGPGRRWGALRCRRAPAGAAARPEVAVGATRAVPRGWGVAEHVAVPADGSFAWKVNSSLKSGGVGTLVVLFLCLVLLFVFAWIRCKRRYSCLLPPGVSK